MKVLPFKIVKSEQHSILYQKDCDDAFYDALHNHKEIQLSLILKGEGTFVIGDCVGDFKPNDIFIIGEYLPHVFKSDKIQGEKSEMISLFFTEQTFGESFFRIPELAKLNSLLIKAQQGIKTSYYPKNLRDKFILHHTLEPLSQFINFIEILSILSTHKGEKLSSPTVSKKYSDEDGSRMRDIFQFTLNNFNGQIQLDEVADLANMTIQGFCRYFKKRTNKTYFNFLIDIRVGHACKLLSKDELDIAEVAYLSGFNNITHFNRKFKEKKKMTPTAYRKNLRSEKVLQ
ncbi:AraC family transcriptional regulator [Namhaeicola litoreus]|uniref:AraC family transcriptional regulator n=1 Tax=Namhaeicola litoreus TaxID=1052145 RepID=A0ABW3XYL8_9FLAO